MRQIQMDPAIHHTRGHRKVADQYLVPRLETPSWKSDRVSPLPAKDHQVPPPSKVGTPEFQEQWDDTVRARTETVQGIHPGWLFKKYNPVTEWAVHGGVSPILEEHFANPDYGRYYKQLSDGSPHPENLAHLVKMDKLTDVGWLVMDFMLREGLMELRPEFDRTPGHDSWADYEAEFGAQLARASADAITWAMEVKSYYCRCRPSEMAERQTYGVTWNLTNQYPEPPHDEYVAGHATNFGACTSCCETMFQYTGDAARQRYSKGLLRYTFYQAGMSRTLGFMHFPEANVQGFLLGYRKHSGRAFHGS